MHTTLLWGFFLGVLLVAAPHPRAAAQTPPRITVRVRQVAGTSLYLDVGTLHGLETGDTVGVARDSLGAPVASLLVTATSESRSVLSFSEVSFQVAGGDVLTLLLLRVPSAPVPDTARRGATGDVALPPRPAAAGAPPEQATRQTELRAPAATPHGRIGFDVAAVRSATRFGGSSLEGERHLFATPAVMLDVTLPRALAGFDLRAGSRLAYRYADPELTTPALSTRVYSAALERSFVRIPLQMTVGRFHSPDEYYSGFWDGFRARYGGAAGVAVLVGFQPDRWNEEPSFERPKASLVLDASARGTGWRWSADASAHRVSETGLLPRHTFAGLSQTLSVGSFRVAQDLQVDRDPGAGGWKVSRLGARGSLSLSEIDLRVGFLRRESYRDWWEGAVFAPREERLSAGVTVQAAGGYLSADVSRSMDSSGEPAMGYTASAAIPGVLPGGGELEGSGSYWSGAHGRAWSAAPSVAFGGYGSQLRLGYRAYGSDFLGRSILTHAGEVSGDLPLGQGRRAALRLTVQRGGSLSSEALTFTFYRLF